jgi:hypothetical protein
VVAGVERLGREGNLVGGVAARKAINAQVMVKGEDLGDE